MKDPMGVCPTPASMLAQPQSLCIWIESMALAHPPPLVGAGRGGGSREPGRLAIAPLRAPIA